MEAPVGTPVAEGPRFGLARFGSGRQLVAAAILALAVLGAGFALWADVPPAAGSSGSANAPAAGAAEDDGLQAGWTNAVEECDCLFGGQ